MAIRQDFIRMNEQTTATIESRQCAACGRATHVSITESRDLWDRTGLLAHELARRAGVSRGTLYAYWRRGEGVGTEFPINKLPGQERVRDALQSIFDVVIYEGEPVAS